MNIKETFESFNSKNILIVGDVMLDSYLWGKVNRISPEAPVPIVSVTKRENRLGGAANVALNIKALGATPIMCSVIGDDEKGRIFNDILEDSKLPAEGIVISENRKTTVKTRVISGTQHTLRVDDEDTGLINETLQRLLIDRITSILDSKKIDALIFQDYDKGVLTHAVIEHTTEIANEKNIPILVDPKKRHFLDFKNVSLFKPNFKELCDGLKLEIKNSDYNAIFEAAKKMIAAQNIKYMLITLSELGVFICDENSYHHIPAVIRQISDVSGAGDTVISVATLCLALGMQPYDIARISNISGGLVCEKSGVVPIEKDLLLKEVTK